MDLTSAKAKRDARMNAKKEMIKGEQEVSSDTGVAKSAEAAELKEVKAKPKKDKAVKTTAPRKAKKESEEKK